MAEAQCALPIHEL